MLLYHLDLSLQKLVVKIEEKGSSRVLYLSTLKTIAKEEDKQALHFLTKIFLKIPNVSRSPDTTPFNKIEIPSDLSKEALELLSKTGRLYFNKTALQGEWASVAKIYWKGEENGPIWAILQWKGAEIPLQECEKLSPGWALWKHVLFPVSTTVAWKWVELFLQGKVVLHGAERKKFLEEDPPILWLKTPIVNETIEIFPELHLSDATGCFANLWMRYVNIGSIAFDDLSPTIHGKKRVEKKEADWEKDLLETGFLKKAVGRSQYYCSGDKVHETLSFLLDLGWKLFSAQGKEIVKQSACFWDIKEEKGLVSVRGKVCFQNMEIPLLSSLAQNRSLWVDLDEHSVGLLDRKKIALPEGVWQEDVFFIKKSLLHALSHVAQNTDTAKWEENLWTLAQGLKEGACLQSCPPSPSFQGTLLGYQQKGVDWLCFLQKWGFSGLLADEMGLGKTVQILAFFSQVRTNLPMLVVAPSSLLHQWKQEISRFLPHLPVYVHAGFQRPRSFSKVDGVIITSYALLRSDEELLASQEFEVIVLDESNAIKTSSTQTAKSACKLKGRFKIALSGTPIENSKEELVSQFKFLMPDFPTSDLESLKKQIRPFILRRKKRDVEIELPEKMDLITWVEMNEPQAALYESYLSNIRQDFLRKAEKEGAVLNRVEILEKILRLRQICVDPRLVGSDIAGAKIELLLEEIQDRKVLIYSQFTSMLRYVAQGLDKENKPYLFLDGSTNPLKRQQMVQQFQEDPSISVFLLSLKAGGVGLNLTAADYVFLLDPWWNDAVEMQAIDRVHRIGRKQTVIAKRYLTPNSIEEKILRLKEKKQGLADLLLDGEDFSWTEEDLFHLLA